MQDKKSLSEHDVISNYIEDFESYIKHTEPEKQEKTYAWATAIGLQQVDGLTPSKYLFDVAKRNIEGEITITQAKELIDSYYQSRTSRKESEDDGRLEEADKVSSRIAEILEEPSFNFSPSHLIAIHRRLFEGIYKFAGIIRDYDITKKEWVLNGDTVMYGAAFELKEALDYDFEMERKFSYKNLSMSDVVKHLTFFVSRLWQIHAFGEGNTRATAVFTIKYLRSLGFNVTNDIFKDNSWYFRNALVRANYKDVQKGIDENPEYLEKFFRNLLMNEHNELKNRYCHIYYAKYAENVGVNNADVGVNVGVNNADVGVNESDVGEKSLLNEEKLISLIKEDSAISAKKASELLSISQRQAERLFAKLKEKGKIKRVGADKNGHWEIVELKGTLA